VSLLQKVHLYIAACNFRRMYYMLCVFCTPLVTATGLQTISRAVAATKLKHYDLIDVINTSKTCEKRVTFLFMFTNVCLFFEKRVYKRLFFFS